MRNIKGIQNKKYTKSNFVEFLNKKRYIKLKSDKNNLANIRHRQTQKMNIYSKFDLIDSIRELSVK